MQEICSVSAGGYHLLGHGRYMQCLEALVLVDKACMVAVGSSMPRVTKHNFIVGTHSCVRLRR
jgi:hypothetical protein